MNIFRSMYFFWIEFFEVCPGSSFSALKEDLPDIQTYGRFNL